jgi:predicted MFS family arabinose efflux permease
MPPALQGRVFAAAGATTQAAIGVGTAAAAPLVTALGAAHAMTAAGTLAALAALAALTCLRWSARAQPQPQSDSGVH